MSVEAAQAACANFGTELTLRDGNKRLHLLFPTTVIKLPASANAGEFVW
jgi:hypothetical protein